MKMKVAVKPQDETSIKNHSKEVWHTPRIISSTNEFYHPVKELFNSNQRQTHIKRKSQRNADVAGLVNYLKGSTLHGVRYIVDSNISYGERIFWLVGCVSAIAMAIYFISGMYDKYNINPVIISVNPVPTPVEDIPFPAVTICNMNAAKKSEADIVMKSGSDIEQILLQLMCDMDVSPKLLRTVPDNETVFENAYQFISGMIQPCSEMLRMCKWRMKKVKCERYFHAFETDSGTCCTFNRLPINYTMRNPGKSVNPQSTYDRRRVIDWNPEIGYGDVTNFNVFPYRSPGPGAHLGLTLVLDADVDNYYCSTSNSAGFKVLLHNPAEISKMTDYSFIIPPGFEIHAVFKPIINDATPTIKSIPTEKRQCYFMEESHLAFYRSYNRVNCKMECLSNITLKRCGCVPYYFPRNNTIKVCGIIEEACTKSVQESFDRRDVKSKDEKHCNCIPACFQLEYEKSMSYGKFLNNTVMKPDVIQNFSPTYFRLVTWMLWMWAIGYAGQLSILTYLCLYPKLTFRSFRRNMAIVHIYFTVTQFSKFTKSELYGFSEFLSNTGGLLGLFLGFSCLSLVEILYHLTLKLLCSNLRKYIARRK